MHAANRDCLDSPQYLMSLICSVLAPPPPRGGSCNSQMFFGTIYAERMLSTNYYDVEQSATDLVSGVIPLLEKKQPISRKNDGRLFPQEHLYCEQPSRPSLRGKLHLVCSLILMLGMWHLLSEANEDDWGMIAAFLYVASNVLSYAISGLYHCVDWNTRAEILMQKLDHVGVAVLTCGSFVPLQLLLIRPLRPKTSTFFMLLCWSSCAWLAFCVFCRSNTPKGALFRQGMVVASAIPFIPSACSVMNSLEISMMVLALMFHVLATSVFHSKRPNPFPLVCGFYEIFHFLTVAAGLCVYVANWSIIRRSSNPYNRHPDILEFAQDSIEDYGDSLQEYWDAAAQYSSAQYASTLGVGGENGLGGSPVSSASILSKGVETLAAQIAAAAGRLRYR